VFTGLISLLAVAWSFFQLLEPPKCLDLCPSIFRPATGTQILLLLQVSDHSPLLPHLPAVSQRELSAFKRLVIKPGLTKCSSYLKTYCVI
jgi:hypothetical protein